jgi:hypothetical protein
MSAFEGEAEAARTTANDPFGNPKVPIFQKTILVEWHSVWFDHKNELDAG